MKRQATYRGYIDPDGDPDNNWMAEEPPFLNVGEALAGIAVLFLFVLAFWLWASILAVAP